MSRTSQSFDDYDASRPVPRRSLLRDLSYQSRPPREQGSSERRPNDQGNSPYLSKLSDRSSYAEQNQTRRSITEEEHSYGFSVSQNQSSRIDAGRTDILLDTQRSASHYQKPSVTYRQAVSALTHRAEPAVVATNQTRSIERKPRKCVIDICITIGGSNGTPRASVTTNDISLRTPATYQRAHIDNVRVVDIECRLPERTADIATDGNLVVRK